MPFERHPRRRALRGARDIRTLLTPSHDEAGWHRAAR